KTGWPQPSPRPACPSYADDLGQAGGAQGCHDSRPEACGKGAAVPASSYLDYSGRDDVLGGGARKIPVNTPKGTFNVWIKRIGNDPALDRKSTRLNSSH